jgi:hypothetical protein
MVLAYMLSEFAIHLSQAGQSAKSAFLTFASPIS